MSGPGEWSEIEATPEGLDVAGLGALPVEHKGAYYAKNPHTGKVFKHVKGPSFSASPYDPFATLASSLASSPASPISDLRQALLGMGEALAAYANGVAAATPPGGLPPIPPALQQVITDGQAVATAYTKALAYAQSLATANATLTQAAGAQAQQASAASSGMSKSTVGIIAGVAGSVAGFAGGMLTEKALHPAAK
jgi:hypothetical protein